MARLIDTDRQQKPSESLTFDSPQELSSKDAAFNVFSAQNLTSVEHVANQVRKQFLF
jgi:hypothetical protein